MVVLKMGSEKYSEEQIEQCYGLWVLANVYTGTFIVQKYVLWGNETRRNKAM